MRPVVFLGPYMINSLLDMISLVKYDAIFLLNNTGVNKFED